MRFTGFSGQARGTSFFAMAECYSLALYRFSKSEGVGKAKRTFEILHKT